MREPDVPDASRRDVIWRRDDTVANYLGATRQAIPLAAEQLDAAMRAIGAFAVPTRSVLDVGSGGGSAAAAISQCFPVERITLVDFSMPMLRQRIVRFEGSPWLVDLIEADLQDPAWQDELPADQPAYDLVVSRYAIHHLPDDRKQDLYAEIFGRTAPGGLFVNIEHVSSVAPVYEDIFESLIVEGMAATSETGQDLAAATTAFHARQDRETNILAPADLQCGWLRDTGFVDVNVLMKTFELAVIVGRRPNM
ncbi:MAG TPA: class I SAM-dependent methyltransferase [Thermomicrobiales bacterium]|nr:class I SAM-dependent methyltransferase [Thermomicrobiales bacterium]